MSSSSSCSVKLSTIVDNKIGLVPNKENSIIIAQEIVENLESALEEVSQIEDELIISK